MPFVNISRPTHSSGGGSAGPEGPPGPEGPAADLSAYAETAYVDTQDEGLQVQIDALRDLHPGSADRTYRFNSFTGATPSIGGELNSDSATPADITQIRMAEADLYSNTSHTPALGDYLYLMPLAGNGDEIGLEFRYLVTRPGTVGDIQVSTIGSAGEYTFSQNEAVKVVTYQVHGGEQKLRIAALEKAVAELKEELPDTADAVWPGPIEVPDGL